MGGDMGLADGEETGEAEERGGETPDMTAAVVGNKDELNIRPGGEEDTEGGEGDIPHEGLDCLSFCLLKIARLRSLGLVGKLNKKQRWKRNFREYLIEFVLSAPILRFWFWF